CSQPFSIVRATQGSLTIDLSGKVTTIGSYSKPPFAYHCVTYGATGRPNRRRGAESRHATTPLPKPLNGSAALAPPHPAPAAADQPQSEPHQRAQHRRHDGVQPQRPTEAQVEEAELDRVGVLDHEDDQRGQAEQGGDGPATEPPSAPSLLGHYPPSGISTSRTWSTRDPVDHAGAACRTATRRRDDGVVTRDSHTAEQDELWDRLREVVGPAHVLTDPEVTASYL